MKRFLGLLRKEFYHIFRDYRTLMILFGIPIAQILIFGFVVTNEIKDVKIAVLDKSKDEYTTAIIDKIVSSGYFILDRELESVSQIEPAFRSGKIKEVIIFEPGFAAKLENEASVELKIIADASDANTGNLIANYTQGVIFSYVSELNANLELPYTINIIPRMFFNQGLKGVYMFVPGTMALILILISAIMTSVSIAREEELGTMETLLVSPLNATQIILGKVAPYILLSFVDALFIIILGYFVFGVPINGSILLLMLVTVLYVSLSLSLGIFISTISEGQQQAIIISMLGLMLPTIILSGFIFPIENMPKVLQWFSTIMPARWFISALKHIMIKGSGFLFVWKEFLILGLMTVMFIILSVKRFKIRLQ